MEARIELAIKGFSLEPDNDSVDLLPIVQSFESVAQWMTWPGAILAFFEDLVGPNGGGSSSVQLQSLELILDHVGYELDPAEKADLSRTLFSDTGSFFRKGQIADWQTHFTPYLEECFEEHAGIALTRFHEARRLLGRDELPEV